MALWPDMKPEARKKAAEAVDGAVRTRTCAVVWKAARELLEQGDEGTTSVRLVLGDTPTDDGFGSARIGAEIARIERALGALLTAMMEDEARWPEPALFHIRATPFDPSKPVRSRADMGVGQLLQEPVYFACRLGVRRLGERLHSIAGGTDGMRHAAHRVASVHPVRGVPILCMLESAWNGVGRDADRWWA